MKKMDLFLIGIGIFLILQVIPAFYKFGLDFGILYILSCLISFLGGFLFIYLRWNINKENLVVKSKEE